MTPDHAMVIALHALAHIAGDEALLERFCRESGTAPAHLKAAAAEPAFLGGALDFMLADEDRLLTFCETQALEPELPARARRALPGAFDDA